MKQTPLRQRSVAALFTEPKAPSRSGVFPQLQCMEGMFMSLNLGLSPKKKNFRPGGATGPKIFRALFWPSGNVEDVGGGLPPKRTGDTVASKMGKRGVPN